jgi:hypothetical protein
MEAVINALLRIMGVYARGIIEGQVVSEPRASVTGWLSGVSELKRKSSLHSGCF